jgi:periplasmic divalent cation tolerance protein
MSDLIELHVTASSLEEAENICEAVIAARLAASVQLSAPVRSTYWWRGEVHHASEIVLTAFTTRRSLPELTRTIRAHHSYVEPQIVAGPIVDGSPEFLAWISSETRAPDEPA